MTTPTQPAAETMMSLREKCTHRCDCCSALVGPHDIERLEDGKECCPFCHECERFTPVDQSKPVPDAAKDDGAAICVDCKGCFHDFGIYDTSGDYHCGQCATTAVSQLIVKPVPAADVATYVSNGEVIANGEKDVLLLASYCDTNADCTDDKPCPVCLGMSNVYRVKSGTLERIRELAPEWNDGRFENQPLASPAPSRATCYRDALRRIAANPSGFDAAGLSEFAETTLALVDSVPVAPSRDSGKCGRCAKPADVYATKSGYGYLCAWCMQCEIIALQAKVEKLSAVQPSRDSGLREALEKIAKQWLRSEMVGKERSLGYGEGEWINNDTVAEAYDCIVMEARAALAASPVDDVERLRRENAELRSSCEATMRILDAWGPERRGHTLELLHEKITAALKSATEAPEQ